MYINPFGVFINLKNYTRQTQLAKSRNSIRSVVMFIKISLIWIVSFNKVK